MNPDTIKTIEPVILSCDCLSQILIDRRSHPGGSGGILDEGCLSNICPGKTFRENVTWCLRHAARLSSLTAAFGTAIIAKKRMFRGRTRISGCPSFSAIRPRDKSNIERLVAADRESLVIWGCEIKDHERVVRHLRGFLGTSARRSWEDPGAGSASPTREQGGAPPVPAPYLCCGWLACCRSGSCPCECLQTARYSARSEISFSRLLVTHDLQKVLRVLRFRLFNSFHQLIQREVIDTIIARSSVIEASLLGSGFPVTRTMWGRWPFPLRIRFSASAPAGAPGSSFDVPTRIGSC